MSLTLCGCYNLEINGVKNAHVNEDGDLILSYFDGTEKNAGPVKIIDNTTNGDIINNNITVNSQGGSDLSLATAKGLMSTVRVICRHGLSGSQGAGVIYKLDKTSGDAYIITNYHVVSDGDANISDDISVYIYGGEKEDMAIKADYVGGSMHYDIAVIKIENSNMIKTSSVEEVTVADSDNIFVGENAIAIGNPKGYGISATCGVISVDSESISMEVDDGTTVAFRVMRIDSAVNSGNSGGGLFNSRGELIGIVNAKINDSSVENMAFAIPVSIATAVADSLIEQPEHDTLQRVLLGIMVEGADSKAVYDTETGRAYISETVKVSDVTEGSVAEGKLAAGDIIKKISIGEREREITRIHHVIDFMLTARLGDTVVLAVERNGEEKTVSFVVTEEYIVSY